MHKPAIVPMNLWKKFLQFLKNRKERVALEAFMANADYAQRKEIIDARNRQL